VELTVKKHAKRTLSLKAETIRGLVNADLRGVAGGDGSALCPLTQAPCPPPVLTATCPTAKGVC